MWTNTYTINDQAAVPQVYNRKETSKDYAIYIDDTARALGVETFFEFRASKPKLKSVITPGLLVEMVRWNCKWSSRVVATDHVAKTASWTVTLPKGMTPTASRIPIKDALLVLNDLINADPERDDVADGRTQ